MIATVQWTANTIGYTVLASVTGAVLLGCLLFAAWRIDKEMHDD